MSDRIRRFRVIEYRGDRDWVERSIAQSYVTGDMALGRGNVLRESNVLADLAKAARKVLADLNARIDAASAAGEPVPVFDGIADLHGALAHLEAKS